MRKLSQTGLAALLALALGLGAAQALDRLNCPSCRRIWLDSPSRMRVTLMYNKHPVDYFVCSPTCYCEVLDRNPAGEAGAALIIDYNDHADTRANLQPAASCYFLLGAEYDEEYSESPRVAAFLSEKEAQEAQKVLGGKLVEWESVLKAAREQAQAKKEKPREPREPLKKRGRMH